MNRAARINRAIANERARLDRMERAASVRLANSYNSALDVLIPMLNDVTLRINDRRAAGLPVTPGWLYQQARYRQMIEQAKEESRKLALVSGQKAIEVSSDAALAGSKQAIELLGMTAQDPNQPGILGVFSGINDNALRAITAQLSPGSPLNTILSEFPGDAEKGLRKMLVTGMALGLGADEMRRNLKKVMGTNLVRANTIIRTEIHRAHRESTRATFQANSGHLNGWIWMADLSARTCAACWAMHGTKHSLEESMGTHPNCRCTMMPWTKSFAELGINVDPALETRVEVPSGSFVFANLSLRDKIAILGPEGYDAYRQGAKLTDFVRVTKSDDWGITRSVRSNAEIRAQHGFTKPSTPPSVPPATGAKASPDSAPVVIVPATPGQIGQLIPAQPSAADHPSVTAVYDNLSWHDLNTYLDRGRVANTLKAIPNAQYGTEFARLEFEVQVNGFSADRRSVIAKEIATLSGVEPVGVVKQRWRLLNRAGKPPWKPGMEEVEARQWVRDSGGVMPDETSYHFTESSLVKSIDSTGLREGKGAWDGALYTTLNDSPMGTGRASISNYGYKMINRLRNPVTLTEHDYYSLVTQEGSVDEANESLFLQGHDGVIVDKSVYGEENWILTFDSEDATFFDGGPLDASRNIVPEGKFSSGTS